MKNIDEYAAWCLSSWTNSSASESSYKSDTQTAIMSIGLAEETGEVMAVLKRNFHDNTFDKSKLISELTDIVDSWIDSSSAENSYEHNKQIATMSIGFTEKVGSVMGILKRFFRDSTFDKAKLTLELGDALYYWTMICNRYGISPSEVIDGNIKKLMDRLKRGVIKGTGDNR